MLIGHNPFHHIYPRLLLINFSRVEAREVLLRNSGMFATFTFHFVGIEPDTVREIQYSTTKNADDYNVQLFHVRTTQSDSCITWLTISRLNDEFVAGWLIPMLPRCFNSSILEHAAFFGSNKTIFLLFFPGCKPLNPKPWTTLMWAPLDRESTRNVQSSVKSYACTIDPYSMCPHYGDLQCNDPEKLWSIVKHNALETSHKFMSAKIHVLCLWPVWFGMEIRKAFHPRYRLRKSVEGRVKDHKEIHLESIYSCNTSAPEMACRFKIFLLPSILMMIILHHDAQM